MHDTLSSNLRDRVIAAVQEVKRTREFIKTPEAIRVLEEPGRITVELQGGKALAIEKGVKPHQMRYLMGSTIPIRIGSGKLIFRKATPLSMMLGKWKHPGLEKKELVKKTIEKAMSGSAEAVMQTKADLQVPSPVKLRTLLGVQ